MNVGLVVAANVALVVARADGEDRLEEGDEFGSGVAAVKVEVYAVVALADEEALGMGLMAEDELLEEEKIDEATAYKIANLLPADRDELRSVFAQERYSLSGEELDDVLDVVAKYA